MSKILIDADGCPVIEETMELAQYYALSVIIVADTSHVMEYEDAEILLADKGRDRTDFVLLQKVEKNDIVVTQDYGLAALVLSRQAYAISQNGLIFNKDNIDGLLANRHQGSIMRKHKKYGSHMRKRSKEDDIQFKEALEYLLIKLQGCTHERNDSSTTDL